MGAELIIVVVHRNLAAWLPWHLAVLVGLLAVASREGDGSRRFPRYHPDWHRQRTSAAAAAAAEEAVALAAIDTFL